MNEQNYFQYILEALWDFIVLLVMTFYWYGEALYRFFVPPAMKSLNGEIVLITGAGKGIGREVCLQLAPTGVKIICWDVDGKASDDMVKELKVLGCTAYSYKVDVSDRSQVEAAALKVKEEIGDVTILINNAGIMPCKEFLDQSVTELEQSFKINVFAHFWTLREFLPKMISLNKGHIVTVCSAAGLIPVRNLAPYCGTKFAVNGFTEGLKDELRHHPKKPDIKFTTIYPFSCNTGLLSGIRSYSRFPWLINPILEPVDVAEKLIDGLRRNYEHVYMPGLISFAGNSARCLLPKVQNAATDFIQCFVEPVSQRDQ